MKIKQERQFHYGWIILILCFLSVFTAFGFGSSPNTLYLTVITKDLGISRSLYSIADSCRYIATAVVNLFFGKLIAKYGARKLFTAGYVCLAAYCSVNAAAQQVWHFYVGGTLLGIGLSWTTISLVGVLVEDWVDGNKGTVMGLILAANGLGGAVATQIVPKFFYDTSGNILPGGWRTSYLVCAAVMAAIGTLGLLLLRNTPADKNCKPFHIGHRGKQAQRNSDWIGLDAHTALRRPYFYSCVLSVFLMAVSIISIGTISTAHLLDRGIPNDAVVNSVSIGALLLMVSKTSTGFIFDRIGLRRTSLFCQCCTIASIALLIFADSGSDAMLYQLVWAFGLPLNTIVLPLITKECFGLKAYPFLMGLMVSTNAFGSVISPPIMNWIYDITGSYQIGLVIMLALMAIATIIMQIVISESHKERKMIEITR